jgi:hypothetical protein
MDFSGWQPGAQGAPTSQSVDMSPLLSALGLSSANSGFQPGAPPPPSPALGLTMIQNPEAVVGHLAASGVAPPQDQPDGVTPDMARDSLGKSLSEGSGFVGVTGQQGEADVSRWQVQPPTPAPETANDQGAATPAPNTSAQPGGLGKQAEATTTQKPGVINPIDDLSKTLAGIKPIPPPAPPVVHTPEAYHPSNQISRSTLPSVLLQQLGNITKGTTGPYRLGQALQGLKNG